MMRRRSGKRRRAELHTFIKVGRTSRSVPSSRLSRPPTWKTPPMLRPRPRGEVARNRPRPAHAPGRPSRRQKNNQTPPAASSGRRYCPHRPAGALPRVRVAEISPSSRSPSTSPRGPSPRAPPAARAAPRCGSGPASPARPTRSREVPTARRNRGSR